MYLTRRVFSKLPINYLNTKGESKMKHYLNTMSELSSGHSRQKSVFEIIFKLQRFTRFIF